MNDLEVLRHCFSLIWSVSQPNVKKTTISIKALLAARGDVINLSLEHTARKNHEITDALELKRSLTLCESQKKYVYMVYNMYGYLLYPCRNPLVKFYINVTRIHRLTALCS